MNAARYAYLNARISVFAGRLVPDRQIADYIDSDDPTCMPGGASHLDKFFALAGEQSELLQRALLIELLRNMQVLLRPLTGTERDFISYSVHLFELANLKAVIRGKFSGIPNDIVREQLTDLGDFVTLPLEQLLRTEDLPELLRVLETTVYASIARHVRRIYRADHDLFAVDAAIDRHYFMGLHRRIYALEADQRGALLRLLGIFLDRVSLIWLLRYRFAYGLSAAETFYQLVPSCGTLNADRLQALVQLDSLPAVLQALPERPFAILQGSDSTREVEDRMEAALRGAARTALRDIGHPLARTFAFFLLKDAQLREVLAVCKGKNLGFSTALIRQASRIETAAA